MYLKRILSWVKTAGKLNCAILNSKYKSMKDILLKLSKGQQNCLHQLTHTDTSLCDEVYYYIRVTKKYPHCR